VRELAPWQGTTVRDVTITATPAEHTGPPPAEVNFVLQCGELRLFFGGDARWSGHFAVIAQRLGPFDVALLPIGGTLIFGQRTTMDPADAVRACGVLQPRWCVPLHEGGEWLPVPPLSWHPGRFRTFEFRLRRDQPGVTPVVLAPGDTARFGRGQVDVGRFDRPIG
jgi:L-ascorbate metabolism protein UlaG (beta-lactamase superfamily)